jgi:hypothetical protein
MYGYIANSPTYDEGPCYFYLDDPGTIEYFQETESDDFLSGGTGSIGEWWACENSTGALWEIDPYTGDMKFIGGGGVGLNGLTYDAIYNRLYGASGSGLYEIDPDTGEQLFIGSFGSSVNEMIAIACDLEGTMFGWDLGDKLWVIDRDTAEVYEIGSLGIDLNYAQDGGFNWEEDTLYLSAYTVSPNYGSYLYECDKETAECTLIGQIEDNSQITASAVSLGWVCCDHDVGVKEILKPEDPSHAVPEMDMEVIVKNYGANTETFDAQMEIYNQSSTLLMEEDFSGPFPPEGWETDSWVQCNDSCSPDPPYACIDNEGQYYNAYITSKAVDASEYKRCSLRFYLCADFYYPQYCSFYVKYRRNESSPWKDVTPWDNPLQEGFEGDLFEIDIYSFEGCGEALQIKWNYFGYYYYSNYVCLDTIILEGTNESIEYAELVEDITLAPGEVTTVEFPKWTPSYWQDPDYENTWQEFPVGAFTLLEGDNNPGNDNKWKNIDVYFPWFHDIEITSIYPWEDGPGKTYPVEATIKNVGQYADCCIHIEISVNEIELESEYTDQACQGDDLEPGESRTFTFDDWTPDYLQYETSGSKDYIIQSEIEMQGDQNPDNDMKTENFTLDYWHDPALKEVTSPPPIGGGQEVLWNNGEPDGRNGLAGGEYYGQENLCIDDFELSMDSTATGGQFHFLWNSGAGTGNIDEVEVYFYENLEDECDPSKDEMEGTPLVCTVVSEETGGSYFGRTEIIVVVEFEEVPLNAGEKYWVGFQPDPIGEDLAYILTAEDKGCDMNWWGEYWGYSKWRTAQQQWGSTYDAAFQLHGYSSGPPGIDSYIQPGTQPIDALAINNGVWPELDLVADAEIWEYITNPENGTLQYQSQIVDVDLDTPLGGTVPLPFEDFTFAYEGRYGLYVMMPDNDGNDDFPKNNNLRFGVGVDATPPESDHVLTPENPDGDNDWYVSDLEVALSASDPLVADVSSGVKEIKYQVGDGPVETIDGSAGTFLITVADDNENIEVTYWAIDNVGNAEATNLIQPLINMDQTEPEIDLYYEVDSGNPQQGWKLIFTAYADDFTSLMDRVEFYLNGEWQETVYGPGPEYQWIFIYHGGLNLIITAKGFDNAGNMASDSVENPTSYTYNLNTQQQKQSGKSSNLLYNSQQNIFNIPGGGFR